MSLELILADLARSDPEAYRTMVQRVHPEWFEPEVLYLGLAEGYREAASNSLLGHSYVWVRFKFDDGAELRMTCDAPFQWTASLWCTIEATHKLTFTSIHGENYTEWVTELGGTFRSTVFERGDFITFWMPLCTVHGPHPRDVLNQITAKFDLGCPVDSVERLPDLRQWRELSRTENTLSHQVSP